MYKHNLKVAQKVFHCVNNVQIRIFPGPYFPVFGHFLHGAFPSYILIHPTAAWSY